MSEKDFLFRRFISLACQPLYLLALSPSSLTEMPNPAGFYSFVVPRPPGTNCKARRSVSISTSIHLTKDAAEISNKVSCRLLYELRFFVMINYDFQKTAVYKNCGSFGLFIGLLRCLYLEQKLFLYSLYLKRKNEKPAILADSSLMEIT